MPKPSWEVATNASFHGYLKFLDFQGTRGLDVHMTFQKDKKVHVSVYDLGDKKKGDNTWMTVGTYGLTLSIMDWYVLRVAICGAGASFPGVEGYEKYEDFFIAEGNKKAVELAIISTKPSMIQSAPPSSGQAYESAFPKLG